MQTRKVPERVRWGEGFIYNAFPTLQLTDRYEVIVPTLAMGQEDARRPKRPMFDHDVEHEDGSDRLRIVARCLGGHTCKGQFLVDESGGPATEFFIPREGLDLTKRNNLPSVRPHTFGLIMMMVAANELFEEAQNKEGVGIVTKI